MTPESTSFNILMRRLQSGDSDAASELVRQYEPEVRRFVRFRLFTSNLRRIVDSVDVSQSVLGRFFVQLEAGEISVHNHEQLRRLLLVMTRNQLFDVARRQKAQKRDVGKIVTGEFDMVADSADSPSQQIAEAELLDLVQARLSDYERRIVAERLSERPWDEIAAELGSTAEAVRKQMTRAIDRAAKELGVIE